MGPIWGRQDPGGPHVGPMNFAIWEGMSKFVANAAFANGPAQLNAKTFTGTATTQFGLHLYTNWNN